MNGLDLIIPGVIVLIIGTIITRFTYHFVAMKVKRTSTKEYNLNWFPIFKSGTLYWDLLFTKKLKQYSKEKNILQIGFLIQIVGFVMAIAGLLML